MLTAQQVGAKQFRTTRIKEGYDQEDVDNFLDVVEDSLAQYQAKVAKLEKELRQYTEADTKAMPRELLTTKVVKQETPLESADRLLKVAEQTANEHVEEAKTKADAIIREANIKSDDVIREAGAKGVSLIEESQQAADELKDRARSEADEIRRKKDELSDQVQQLALARQRAVEQLEAALAKMKEDASHG